MQGHEILASADTCQGRFERHERWPDRSANDATVRRALRPCDLTNGTTHLPGVEKIHLGKGIDAASLDGARRHVNTQRDLREDRQLGLRIDPLDILRGIRLGQPEGLCLHQRIAKRQTVALHTAQDVVAGTVQDAGHTRQTVARQPVLDSADDRDASGDRCLEAQMAAGARRLSQQVGAGVRDDLLVRGHDRLAGPQCFPNPLLSRRASSNQFDDDINVVAERVVDAFRPAYGWMDPVDVLSVHRRD